MVTVILTVNLAWIPKRGIQHQSTSVEDSRRFVDVQPSRSIAVSRVITCDPQHVSTLSALREEIAEKSASNTKSCCRVASLGRFFHLHSVTSRTQRPWPRRSASWFPRTEKPIQRPSARERQRDWFSSRGATCDTHPPCSPSHLACAHHSWQCVHPRQPRSRSPRRSVRH